MSLAEAHPRPDSPAETPYLSPAEFVRLSGLSLATVRRYLANDRLPKVQPGGRRCRVLIPRDALEGVEKPAGPVGEEPLTDPTVSTKPEIQQFPKRSSQLGGPVPKWMGRRQ